MDQLTDDSSPSLYAAEGALFLSPVGDLLLQSWGWGCCRGSPLRSALPASADEGCDDGEAWGLYQPFLPAPVGSHASTPVSSSGTATPALLLGCCPPSHPDAVRAGLLGGAPTGGVGVACCLGAAWPAGGVGCALLPCQSLGLNFLSLDCGCCCLDGSEPVALPVSLHKETKSCQYKGWDGGSTRFVSVISPCTSTGWLASTS